MLNSFRQLQGWAAASVTIGLRGAALLVLLGCVAPAAAVQWTMVDRAAPDSAAALSTKQFAAAVTRASAGALSVQHGAVPAGLTPAGLLDAVSGGKVVLAALPLAALESDDAVVAMDRVPYLASNFVDAAKLWQVLRPYVRDRLKARGLDLLYAVAGAPIAPLSRKPFVQMAAWRGSRIILDSPALRGFAAAVGAVTVGEAPARQLLGATRADVLFQSAPAAVADRAWEYAGEYLLAPAWFPKQLVVVNSRQLAALPPRERDQLLNAADAAARSAWMLSEGVHARGVQQLRDYGIKTREPPIDTLIQLEALGRELLFQWSEQAGEAGAQLVEAYYAIR